ncbi:MAG: RDD family protein [bacterium]
MIRITCPFCSYSKEVPEDKIPAAVSQIKCPMCNELFSYTFIEHKRAGFFSRLLAFTIDMLILNALFLIISFILDFFLSYLFQYIGITDEDFSYKVIGSIIYFTCVLVMFFYFTYSTHRTGMTIGKKVLGIKVVNEYGQNPEISEAIKREVFGKMLSGLFMGLGFIWALFDKKNQALHDKIAKTYVIYT